MRCAICGNADDNRTWHVREMMFGTRDTFAYVECARCGCLQLADPPADLGRYYPQGYYSFAADSGHPAQRLVRRLRDSYALRGRGLAGRLVAAGLPGALNVAEALRALRPLGLARQARILDVGCGSGRLLRSLRNLGFERLLGIDAYVERDIAYADGLRVLRRAIEQAEGQWDVVMFHHSFEHMPGPLAALRAAARLLAPGGTCLIRTPTVSSYAWRHYRADWAQIDAPRHTFLHSAESMARLAGAAGLALAAVAYDSSAFQFWASEQYRRDIPLLDARSYRCDPARSIFSRAQIAAFSRRARELNRRGEGDQAAFYLRKGACGEAGGDRAFLF